MLRDWVWGFEGFFRVFRLVAFRVALLLGFGRLLFKSDLLELFGVIWGLPIIGLLEELLVRVRAGLPEGLKAKFDVIWVVVVVVMVSSGVSSGTSMGLEAGEIDLARSFSLFSRDGAKRGFSPWWRGVRIGLPAVLGFVVFLANILFEFFFGLLTIFFFLGRIFRVRSLKNFNDYQTFLIRVFIIIIMFCWGDLK